MNTSTNTYSVVHFIDDNSLEAIPGNWFNSVEQVCTWPQRTQKKLLCLLKKMLCLIMKNLFHLKQE